MDDATATIRELRTDFRAVKRKVELHRFLTFDRRQQELAAAVGLKLIRP